MAKIVNCPMCGAPGAHKTWCHVKCSTRLCPNYDPSVMPASSTPSYASAPAPEPEPAETDDFYNPLAEQAARVAHRRGDFEPGVDRINVHYTNFEGEKKTYVGDRRTIRRKRKHLSLCLVPTGERCAFARERLDNLQELERYLPGEDKLTPTERQILGYHQKHGTTSPRYQEVQRKLASL